MKLTGLKGTIKDWAGKDAMIADDGELGPFTIKTALLQFLGTMRTPNGKDAIHVYALGCRLFPADDELEAESADVALLKKATEQNAPGYAAVVQAQVLQYLDNTIK